MPFRSQKQRRFLWMHHPEIAKKWTKEHGSKIVPSKKKKKKRKKKSSYVNIIMQKVGMSAQDYYSTMTPFQKSLIYSLEDKDKLSTAYAATKVMGILKDYMVETKSELELKKDPQKLFSRLLQIIERESGDEYNKIKNVAQHIAAALIQKVGRTSKAAMQQTALNKSQKNEMREIKKRLSKPLYEKIRKPIAPPTLVERPDVGFGSYDRKRTPGIDVDDDIWDEVREIQERKKRSQARLEQIKKIS